MYKYTYFVAKHFVTNDGRYWNVLCTPPHLRIVCSPGLFVWNCRCRSGRGHQRYSPHTQRCLVWKLFLPIRVSVVPENPHRCYFPLCILYWGKYWETFAFLFAGFFQKSFSRRELSSVVTSVPSCLPTDCSPCKDQRWTDHPPPICRNMKFLRSKPGNYRAVPIRFYWPDLSVWFSESQRVHIIITSGLQRQKLAGRERSETWYDKFWFILTISGA